RALALQRAVTAGKPAPDRRGGFERRLEPHPGEPVERLALVVAGGECERRPRLAFRLEQLGIAPLNFAQMPEQGSRERIAVPVAGKTRKTLHRIAGLGQTVR